MSQPEDPADVAELARLEAIMASSCVDEAGYLDGNARAAQKQASRDRDVLLVKMGRMTPAEIAAKNTHWWAGIDFSTLRIVAIGDKPYVVRRK